MMFHDAVLKIEKASDEVRREERVISWLGSRLYVPSTIMSVEEKSKKNIDIGAMPVVYYEWDRCYPHNCTGGIVNECNESE